MYDLTPGNLLKKNLYEFTFYILDLLARID